MSSLRLSLLGSPRIERDGVLVEFGTRKNVALVAYLAVTGKPHTREALITLLWPELEPSRARAGLRRNLSMLRKTLGEEWLVVDRDMVGLYLDPGPLVADVTSTPGQAFWLDVEQFQPPLQAWQEHGHSADEVCSLCLAQLAEAVELYQGDFMAGFSLRDSANFDEWQFFQTEELRGKLASALERLVRGHSDQAEFEQALTCARRWLALDPLHELAHRQLMRLYAWSGQRAAALRQYIECERGLQDELGILPEDETTQLYKAIREKRLSPPPEGREIARTPSPTDALHDRYRLDAELGRGGMGTVYRAHDTVLARDVAVKVLDKTSLGAEGRARLLREAQVVAQLNHPNIVTIHDAGIAGGVPFIVMELVQGESLRAGQVDNLPYNLEEVLAVMQQVCAALEHAHARGIIHRDVKPENVLVAPDGCAKLADFGLARTAASRLTTEGGIVGTVFYFAPEQASGQELDHRADLYALGIMLYELTAGRLPFTDGDVMSIISQHLHASVVPPSAHNTEIPPALDTLIVQLLSKRPRDRPASAAEVRRRLAGLSTSVQAITSSTEELLISRTCSHNLPAQITPFVGRGAQLAAVRQKLAGLEGGEDGVRLLTLTGPGGTGKTRLALQAAADLQDNFGDGAFFVALAPVGDPALVLPAIAQTLGVGEVESEPLLETCKDYLRDKRVLLLLDNFEQVIEAAPLVSDLLAAAPGLQVLATSRASLRLSGEHIYPVPPLDLPDSQESPSIESLAQVEAVQLFVQRARTAKAGFELTGENGPLVAAICERLDGLPLAIELAAARVRFLPPHKMLAQLKNRLRLLTGGARDLPARHQTLRGAIDWGYDLLSTDEKTLFRRMAVFCSSCTLEAVEAVCNGSADLDVLNGLESLVDQSLLKPSDVDADGEPRFGMLETIREYALERLADSGEAEMIRRQHAGFFVTLAQDAEPRLESAEQVAWLGRLEAEHDNVRAALGWALECEGPDAELGVRLAGALGRFWRIRGYWTEGRQWVDRALEKSGCACPSVRAKALWTAGRWRETAERARPLLRESLTLYRQMEDKRGIARTLYRLGRVADDFEQEAALYEQSLALFRELDDKPGIVESLFWLGIVAWRRQGDRERGRALLEQSLALARELGDKWRIARRLRQLGNIAIEQADHWQAAVILEESLVLVRELGDKEGIAGSLNAVGEMARLQGDYEWAAALYDESLAIRRELGNKFRIALVLHNRGHVALRQDDARQAAAFFKESLALYRQLNMAEGSSECLAGLAGVAGAAGQPERAARLFGAAEAMLEAIGSNLATADQVEWDYNVDIVRDQLDEETFAAAWAEGQAQCQDTSVAELWAELEDWRV